MISVLFKCPVNITQFTLLIELLVVDSEYPCLLGVVGLAGGLQILLLLLCPGFGMFGVVVVDELIMVALVLVLHACLDVGVEVKEAVCGGHCEDHAQIQI